MPGRMMRPGLCACRVQPFMQWLVQSISVHCTMIIDGLYAIKKKYYSLREIGQWRLPDGTIFPLGLRYAARWKTSPNRKQQIISRGRKFELGSCLKCWTPPRAFAAAQAIRAKKCRLGFRWPAKAQLPHWHRLRT